MKKRNVLTMTALSALLSTALVTSPAFAESNDTWKTIRNGWLSEYQLQSGEALASSGQTYRAISAENETYASAHNGWLNEYRLQPGEEVASTGKTFRAISAENETYVTIHNGWLSELEGSAGSTSFAAR